ncbi:MAG: hypothetical protein N3E49_05075 [Bacteroidia bacterium]|nr:hypothetical protein [Bacteroidia bacterium]
MKYAWIAFASFLWAQPTVPDSLRELFEKDFAFDLVIGRSFPLVPTLTDTYPIVPLLSGHWRIGIAWHLRFYRLLGLTVQSGYAWYKHVLRATTASTAPYVDLLPDGYRWLRYRQGAIFLQGGLHWRQERQGEFFPRYWIEIGGWLQRQVGTSLKYVAVRGERTERVRWEGLRLFSPWQGGLYFMIGRQLLGLSAYYHLFPLFPKEQVGTIAPRRFPGFSRWEVGFLVSL